MSRSAKKTPIIGIAICASEKCDKKAWHSRMRQKEKRRLKTNPDSVTVVRQEVSDPWMMGKDGKQYWPEGPVKVFRK